MSDNRLLVVKSTSFKRFRGIDVPPNRQGKSEKQSNSNKDGVVYYSLIKFFVLRFPEFTAEVKRSCSVILRAFNLKKRHFFTLTSC